MHEVWSDVVEGAREQFLLSISLAAPLVLGFLLLYSPLSCYGGYILKQAMRVWMNT